MDILMKINEESISSNKKLRAYSPEEYDIIKEAWKKEMLRQWESWDDECVEYMNEKFENQKVDAEPSSGLMTK